eukprot:CAMPEP_0117695966 /NCGR_PEP_ID=MMETSP0804-20121206/28428_1 /TAXON_ID=1074897 /ORGANISM="Tetraselmis astigmatica, Strain CCMP880" /LENGTH=105 /DNA_ID=CAMNT_0005510087 /DNA_START=162 /DNA_END=477 /DNA_ORIENTATION=-
MQRDCRGGEQLPQARREGPNNHDDQQINSTGSDIKSLHAKGIPVRHDGSQQYHMHHKFAVFDCALVATGSFNWTRQAVLHNQENIVVLKGADVAKQYQSEFDKMW